MPGRLLDLAAERETVVVLTAPFLEINQHLKGGTTREQVVDVLRPLLDLPFELVLPTHGAPADRAGLERALNERALS